MDLMEALEFGHIVIEKIEHMRAVHYRCIFNVLTIAAPRIALRLRYIGLFRILMDIANDGEEILIRIYRFAFESPLHKMPNASVPFVEIHCIGGIDGPHGLRKIRKVDSEKAMNMIVHEAPCKYVAIMFCNFSLKKIQVSFAIAIVLEYDLAPYPTGYDMIDVRFALFARSRLTNQVPSL